MKPLKSNATLHEIQQHLDELCRMKGWDKNSISEVFLLLNEEIGELAKEIRKYTGFKGEQKTTTKKHLEEELADVFNYILEIANRFEINLEEVYIRKNAKNLTREWK